MPRDGERTPTQRRSPRRKSRDASPEELVLETPLGPARAYVHRTHDLPAAATLVLGHGAGRGSDTNDLLDLAAALPVAGISVIRFDQPWVVAGRRVAPPPALLDRGLVAALPQLPVVGGLVLGGRSAGARAACRVAHEMGGCAVVALAFPLHPPGRPDRSRAPELTGSRVPVLVLQGERDAFGGPEEVRDAVLAAGEPAAARVEIVPVPGADHGLRRGLPPALVERVGRWVLNTAVG